MNRGGVLLVAVSLVAGLGNTAMSLAAAVWVMTLTGSSALAALAGFFVYAPTLLGPLLGAIVDRAPVRPVLVTANLVLGGLLATLVAEALARPPAFLGVLSSIQGAGAIVGGVAAGWLMKRLGGETPVAVLGACLFDRHDAGLRPARTRPPLRLAARVHNGPSRIAGPGGRPGARRGRLCGPPGTPAAGRGAQGGCIETVARVVVVGGGIAGLAAAHRLRELGPADLEIVLLERADRLGGKINTQPLAAMPFETGAETFLMRDAGADSAALALARRLGLTDALRHPAPAPAALALDGALRPIPAGTLLGIPADPAAVHDVAAISGTDTDEGHPLLSRGEDVTVGALVRARLGDDVVQRVVDPLLGGVYAGRADDLSLQATMPSLHRAAQTSHTLADAVAQAMGAAPRPAGSPVFATVHGGLSRLVTAVAEASRARIQLGQTVRALDPTARGWRLTVGPTAAPAHLDADAVVLAVPATPGARLLRTVSTEAADAVGELAYASVALVTLALPPPTVLPPLSGFLVPAGQGFAVKAATFITTKWPHLAPDAFLLRASLGRHGENDVLQRTDDSLVELVRSELPRLVGAPLPAPVATRVTRWGGALPQYGVGHVARIAAVRSPLPATLALAGAAFDGVGIAACVRSGEAAADQVWGALHGRPIPATPHRDAPQVAG